MIRVVAVGALLALLALVLYLPSAHPPEHFVAQVRAEQQAMAQLWGEAPAHRILARALWMVESAREATPVPSAADAPAADAVTGAVAQEMAAVNRRLFDNGYFRAIDALLLLAIFRVSTILHWLPWLVAFAAAALADGAIARHIRSAEFRRHDPEMFALCISLAILLACAAVVGLVVPVNLHPLVVPALVLVVSALVGRAIANFHRRGA